MARNVLGLKRAGHSVVLVIRPNHHLRPFDAHVTGRTSSERTGNRACLEEVKSGLPWPIDPGPSRPLNMVMDMARSRRLDVLADWGQEVWSEGSSENGIRTA